MSRRARRGRTRGGSARRTSRPCAPRACSNRSRGAPVRQKGDQRGREAAKGGGRAGRTLHGYTPTSSRSLRSCPSVISSACRRGYGQCAIRWTRTGAGRTVVREGTGLPSAALRRDVLVEAAARHSRGHDTLGEDKTSLERDTRTSSDLQGEKDPGRASASKERSRRSGCGRTLPQESTIRVELELRAIRRRLRRPGRCARRARQSRTRPSCAAGDS